MIATAEHLPEPIAVDRLANRFVEIFPTLDTTGQRVALQAYRQLAKGDAASAGQIADAAGVSVECCQVLWAAETQCRCRPSASV